MLKKNLFYWFCSLLCFVSCSKDVSFDGAYPASQRAILYNVPYGKDSLQTMDLYLPKNRNVNTKTVMFIHGGGWTKGTKTDFSYLPSLFADSGIIGVSIDYRLADTVKKIDYKTILSDVELAMEGLKKNETLLHATFTRYTLFGESAGGHLAIMYAYGHDNIDQVIAVAAPTNLNDEDLLSAYDMRERVRIMIGSDDANKRMLASPISYDNAITTYLYHGKKDTNVPYQQSVAFYDKIKLLNPKNRLVLFENEAHEILGDPLIQIENETIQLVKKN